MKLPICCSRSISAQQIPIWPELHYSIWQQWHHQAAVWCFKAGLSSQPTQKLCKVLLYLFALPHTEPRHWMVRSAHLEAISPYVTQLVHFLETIFSRDGIHLSSHGACWRSATFSTQSTQPHKFLNDLHLLHKMHDNISDSDCSSPKASSSPVWITYSPYRAIIYMTIQSTFPLYQLEEIDHTNAIMLT